MPTAVGIRIPKTAGAKSFAMASAWADVEAVDKILDDVVRAVSPPALIGFLNSWVSPYFEDQIVDRFAGLGDDGTPGGTWAPLAESTMRIRHALGYFDDYAINERSGDLVEWLAMTRDFAMIPGGAQMTLPDEGEGSGELWHKLKVAQVGHTQTSNEMIPGAYTPPRPVLSMNETDLLAVTKMLHIFIFNYIGKLNVPIGDMG